MSNQNSFKGYHGELNLGSPGGWEYARMIQKIYLKAWKKIKELTKIEVELDLENKLFQPSLRFAEVLLYASKKNFPKKDPFIVLMAEEETLEDVIENSRFVEYLNSLDNVSSLLIGPQELKLDGEKLHINGKEPTVIFIDFNTSVLVDLEKKHSIAPIVEAIRRNIVVNPKGMESINVKEIFEAVDAVPEIRKQLSQTTIDRTPWTRIFYDRETAGPDGAEINLIEWAKKNPDKWVLKPGSGWSGKGIYVGPKIKDDNKKINEAIETALKSKKYGNYIIQKFVPLEIWSETMPIMDENKVDLEQKQTDFRCLMSNNGIVGYLGRFGGIPTNVGSGGGVQALALVTSNHTPGDATKIINKAISELPFEQVKEIKKTLDNNALAMGFKYLLGPIPIGLRPRIINQEQIDALKEYAENLYNDTLILEKMWREGKLDEYTKVSDREEEIIRLQPRNEDTPAMMAVDGLFNFGAE